MESYTEVFVWGSDHFGQLGLGGGKSGKTHPIPRFCSFNILIRSISCGEEHSAFVASNGSVYSMGNNSEGRLGIGDSSLKSSTSPCLVESLAGINALYVSCGMGHTVIISDDGRAFSWGQGEYGALGNGKTDNQWEPQQVALARNCRALQVSCGSRHTAFIVQDGMGNALLTCGAGEAGQLGTGRREREMIPTRVSTEEPKQVSSGVFHTAYSTRNGRVYTMGGNSFGQLGTGNKKSSCIPILVHTIKSFFIDKVTCGNHTAVLTDQGVVYIWGSSSLGEFLTPYKVSNIPSMKDVEIGGQFGCMIDITHRLWVWGNNSNGELGLGDYASRSIPTLVEELRAKKVRAAACGGCYCIALGDDVIGRTKSPVSRANTSFSLNRELDDSFSVVKYEEPTRLRESLNRSRNQPMSRSELYVESEYPKVRSPLRKPRNSSVEPVDRTIDTDLKIELNMLQSRYKTTQEERGREKDIVLLIERELIDEKRRNKDLLQQLDKYKQLELELNELRRNSDFKDRELRTLQAKSQLLIGDKENTENEIERLRTTLVPKDILAELEEQLSETRRNLDHKERELRNQHERNQMLVAEKEKADLEIHRLLTNMVVKDIFEDLEHKFNDVRRNSEFKDREMKTLQNKLQMILLDKQQGDEEIDRLRGELINYEKDYHKLQEDFNSQIQALQDAKGQEDRLMNQIVEMNAEEDKLRRSIEELRQNNWNLTKKDEQLGKEVYELRHLYEQERIRHDKNENEMKERFESEKRQLIRRIEINELELKDTEMKLDEEKNALRGNRDQLEESRNLILNLQKEISVIQHAYSEISSEFNELNNSYQGLARLKDQIEKERNSLLDKLRGKEEDSVRLQREKSELSGENELTKRALDDQKYEIENLNHSANEHLTTIDRMTHLINEWEHKYSNLLQEYNSSRREIAEIEMKNKELFQTLEKELAARAREYKERTLQMLNTPTRSSGAANLNRSDLSPYVHTQSPGIRIKDAEYPEPRSSSVSPMSRLQFSSSNTEKPLGSRQFHLETSSNLQVSSPTRQFTSKRPFEERSTSIRTPLLTPQDVLNEMRSRLIVLQKNKNRAD